VPPELDIRRRLAADIGVAQRVVLSAAPASRSATRAGFRWQASQVPSWALVAVSHTHTVHG
jgi:hypothetical protein